MEENEMIEETVELESPEEVYESEDVDIVESDSDASVLPVIALGGAIVGGVAAAAVAVKKTHFIGRVNAFVSAGVAAFKGYEVPEEESNKKESAEYVEVETVEDSAE